MSIIQKYIAFEVSGKDNIIERTILYFTQSGFKLVQQKEGFLQFTRGSLQQNNWTFNPLKWKSEIKICLCEEEIKGEFCIDSTGQLVTAKEEHLWNTFIENYRLFILENFDYIIYKRELRKIKKGNLRNLGWFILIEIVATIISVFLAVFTECILLIPGIIIVVTSILLVMIRMKKE